MKCQIAESSNGCEYFTADCPRYQVSLYSLDTVGTRKPVGIARCLHSGSLFKLMEFHSGPLIMSALQ